MSDDAYEMPGKMVAQLVGFLEQNNGQLSKRAREKEFSNLQPEEVSEIENAFQELFKEL